MEHPILFSTEMVKALLEGRKTQTRRVIKPQPRMEFDMGKEHLAWITSGFRTIEAIAQYCPYGEISDRLWVRESWASQHKYDHLPPRLIPHDANIHYAASENLGGLMHRPSIFLPRWASRLTLEITDIRVQRLQEISEEDILAEGTPCHHISQHLPHGELLVEDKYDYRKLWDSINGKTHPWESNPWVWAISFKLLEGTK